MRVFSGVVLALLLTGTVAAQQSASPPLEDKRLTIHTLVREDIFAGWMQDDLTRMSRGEANIEKLLVSRPDQKAPLLAWKGGATIYRAVKAREAGNAAEYARLYKTGMAELDEAKRAGPQDGGVHSIVGGSLLLFGDRLAPEHRSPSWEASYQSYNFLWGAQGAIADKLPPHHRGELTAGVVMSAQRTGRTAEANERLDKMLAVVKGTPYEAEALRWKADMKTAPTSSLVCKNCHDDGRLGPTLARLAPKA